MTKKKAEKHMVLICPHSNVPTKSERPILPPRELGSPDSSVQAGQVGLADYHSATYIDRWLAG